MWNTYVALDLETTGLSPMRDQILEIGAARVENGEITALMRRLWTAAWRSRSGSQT